MTELVREMRIAIELAEKMGVRGQHPSNIFNLAERAADALEARAIPDGMVLVPREPTEGMLEAMAAAHETSVADDLIGPMEDAYRAMLSASPTVSASPAGDDGWIEWKGGKRPVETGTLVLVRLAGRGTPRLWSGEARPAEYFDWDWDDADQRIIAYRVVAPPPASSDGAKG